MVSTLMRGFKVTLTPRISVDIIARTHQRIFSPA